MTETTMWIIIGIACVLLAIPWLWGAVLHNRFMKDMRDSLDNPPKAPLMPKWDDE